MLSIVEIDYGTPKATSTTMVELDIDGRSVRVPEGTSVLRAAAQIGIGIPKLCATDMLEAFGSCRLCLVEIEGRKGYPASCTTPVSPGMKVHTQTSRLAEIRRGVMELYISDHPLDCLTCPANGHCELQDMAGVVGLREVRYGYDGANHVYAEKKDGSPNPLFATKDISNPYFTFDPSKCIACSRCVRACEEVQGTFALTIQGRGFESKVAASQDNRFLDSECVSCGACVQACPTATLSEKSLIDMGQAEHSVVTTCAYCGVGCSFRAEMKGQEVVRMVPNKDGHANHGHSCVKGRFAIGYATHPDRITTPMIRAPHLRSLARGELGGSDCPRRQRVQAAAGPLRQALGWRHYLLALHQRGNLSGAKAGTRRLRQQQRRYLCARLPFADRLRPQGYLGRIGGHAGFRLDRVDRRRAGDRCESHRCPSRVRLADEAPPARGRETDRGRSAPHRPGAYTTRPG